MHVSGTGQSHNSRSFQLTHERCIMRVQVKNTARCTPADEGAVGIAELVCAPTRGFLRRWAWFVPDF